jgi:hypothetical protein
MKTAKGAFIGAAAFVMAAAAYAVDSQAGKATSNLLSIQTVARPAAMANAFSAMEGDINSMYRNPAGLGFMRKSEFIASRFSGLGELSANTLGVAIPLGDVNVSNVRHLGVVGVALSNMDYSKEDVFDASGVQGGTWNGSDKELAVSWGKSINTQASVGVTAKLYRVEIFGKSDSGTLIDIGTLYKLVPGIFNVSASALNIGGQTSYEGKGSDPATSYVAGAAFMPFGTDKLALTLDAEKPRDASSAIKTGVEWNPVNALILRAGYDSTYDAGSGISLGMGIVLMNLEVGFFPVDRVTLDYAFTPNSDLDYTHRVALSFRVATQ